MIEALLTGLYGGATWLIWFVSYLFGIWIAIVLIIFLWRTVANRIWLPIQAKLFMWGYEAARKKVLKEAEDRGRGNI